MLRIVVSRVAAQGQRAGVSGMRWMASIGTSNPQPEPGRKEVEAKCLQPASCDLGNFKELKLVFIRRPKWVRFYKGRVDPVRLDLLCLTGCCFLKGLTNEG